MPPGLVQATQTSSTTGGITSLALTYGTTPTSGNLLVACAVFYYGASGNTAADYSVSDTAGNTWVGGTTHAKLYLNDGGTLDGDLLVFYAWNCLSHASNVVTLHESGGTASAGFVALTIAEYSGVQSTSDPFRVANGTINTGASSIPSTSLSGTVTGDLGIGWSNSSNGQTTQGSGFTLDNTPASGGSCVLEHIIVSGTSLTVTSGPSDTPWNIIGVSFIPAASATLPSLAAFSGDEPRPAQRPRDYSAARLTALHEASAFSVTKPLGNTAVLQDHSERSQPRAWRASMLRAPDEASAFSATKPLSNAPILQEDRAPFPFPKRARVEPLTEAVLKATTATVTLGPIAPLQDDSYRQQPRAYRGAWIQVPNEAAGFDATKPLANTPIFQDDSVRQQAPRYVWPGRLSTYDAQAELPDAKPLPPVAYLQDDSTRQRAPQYPAAYRSATNDAQAELPDAHPLSNAILQEDPPPRWRRPAQPEEWIGYDATKPLGNTALLQDDEPPQRAAPIPRGRPLTTVQPEQVFDILNLVLLPTVGGWAVDDARGRWRRIRDTEEVASLADTKPLLSIGSLQEDPASRWKRARQPEEVPALDAVSSGARPSAGWMVDDTARRAPARHGVAEDIVLEGRSTALPWVVDEPARSPARRLPPIQDETQLASHTLASFLTPEEPLAPPPRARRAPGYDDAPLKDVHVVILPSLGWQEDMWQPRFRARGWWLTLVQQDSEFVVRSLSVLAYVLLPTTAPVDTTMGDSTPVDTTMATTLTVDTTMRDTGPV